MKVLIVEDEKRLGEFLRKGLAESFYTTVWARSCGEARDALCETTVDAIILDLTLKDGDGLALLKEWRQCGFNEPVLILSARNKVDDRIKGLNLGADDYLPKPFSFEELLARLHSLLRRQSEKKVSVLEHRGVRMDLLNRTVFARGEELDLTSREFALLEIFLRNVGRVLTRSLISDRIWESPFTIETNLIDVYMSRLRSKLESSDDRPLFKTIRGVGYKMI